MSGAPVKTGWWQRFVEFLLSLIITPQGLATIALTLGLTAGIALTWSALSHNVLRIWSEHGRNGCNVNFSGFIIIVPNNEICAPLPNSEPNNSEENGESRDLRVTPTPTSDLDDRGELNITINVTRTETQRVLIGIQPTNIPPLTIPTLPAVTPLPPLIFDYVPPLRNEAPPFYEINPPVYSTTAPPPPINLPSPQNPYPQSTAIPPSATPEPTNTAVPATATPEPTNTAVPATATPEPTNTAVPATATPEPTNTAVPATATPEPTATSEIPNPPVEAGCTNENPARDLSGKLISNNVGRVNSISSRCWYLVGIASYMKTSDTIDEQVLFHYQQLWIPPGQIISLQVQLPACAVQVDLYYGEVLKSLNGVRYGDRLLDKRHLGSTFCSK